MIWYCTNISKPIIICLLVCLSVCLCVTVYCVLLVWQINFIIKFLSPSSNPELDTDWIRPSIGLDWVKLDWTGMDFARPNALTQYEIIKQHAKTCLSSVQANT